ncbi:MAG: transposase [Clostridia bacterium]|nr:transposase [Clostridia bacterium]
MDYPQRKRNRLVGYDYASPGCYFITICARNHSRVFWTDVGANCVRPQAPLPLSAAGRLVETEIQKLNHVYTAVRVDKYCIMPDHLHMLLFIECDEDGRTQFAPTLSRVVKQFKGSVSKQLGYSVWQKSFYDTIIDSDTIYWEAWRYIDENPLKYALKKRGEL